MASGDTPTEGGTPVSGGDSSSKKKDKKLKKLLKKEQKRLEKAALKNAAASADSSALPVETSFETQSLSETIPLEQPEADHFVIFYIMYQLYNSKNMLELKLT
jgi:hypothetical protein